MLELEDEPPFVGRVTRLDRQIGVERVGFLGQLDVMPLANLVQMLAMSQRTGKLVLTNHSTRAAIAFRNGDIICAASNRCRETLGHMLLTRGLIDETTLKRALEVQREHDNSRLLGSILVDMGAVPRDVMNSLIRTQIHTVLGELLAWKNGLFKFQPLDDLDELPEELRSTSVILEEGIKTEETMLEAAKRLDETSAVRVSGRDGGSVASTIDPGDRLDDTQPAQVELLTDLVDLRPAAQGPDDLRTSRRTEVDEIALVRSIMVEIQAPRFTGEISLMIMRYAADILRRGIFFSVQGEQLSVMGKFGCRENTDDPSHSQNEAVVPVLEAAALEVSIASGQSQRGGPLEINGNHALLGLLDGRRPKRYVTVPMVVNGETVAVLYGDNWPRDGEIGGTDGLELLMIHGGLCVERNQLELYMP